MAIHRHSESSEVQRRGKSKNIWQLQNIKPSHYVGSPIRWLKTYTATKSSLTVLHNNHQGVGCYVETHKGVNKLNAAKIHEATLIITFTCRKPSLRFLEIINALRNRKTWRSPQLPMTRNTSWHSNPWQNLPAKRTMHRILLENPLIWLP